MKIGLKIAAINWLPLVLVPNVGYIIAFLDLEQLGRFKTAHGPGVVWGLGWSNIVNYVLTWD